MGGVEQSSSSPLHLYQKLGLAMYNYKVHNDQQFDRGPST